MKNVFKLGLVLCGFVIATIATTEKVSAQKSVDPGCYGSGQCGVTTNGTILIGKWRE